MAEHAVVHRTDSFEHNASIYTAQYVEPHIRYKGMDQNTEPHVVVCSVYTSHGQKIELGLKELDMLAEQIDLVRTAFKHLNAEVGQKGKGKKKKAKKS